MTSPDSIAQFLRECERLESGATKGPWTDVTWYGADEGGWAAIGPHHERVDDDCDDMPGDEAETKARRDAEFIAASRTKLPQLREALSKALGALADIKNEMVITKLGEMQPDAWLLKNYADEAIEKIRKILEDGK